MEKIEIQKQHGVGLVLVTRKDGDDSWKVVKQCVYLRRDYQHDRLGEKRFYFDDNNIGILRTAPGPYGITTGGEHQFAILGISRSGDGLSDEYWLPYAEDELSWQVMLAERVTHQQPSEEASPILQLSK
jgi:hypothetical protein